MNNVLTFLHRSRSSGQASLLVMLLTCLLIGIRFAAGIIHASCYVDWETPKTRSFHLLAEAIRTAATMVGRPLIRWRSGVVRHPRTNQGLDS